MPSSLPIGPRRRLVAGAVLVVALAMVGLLGLLALRGLGLGGRPTSTGIVVAVESTSPVAVSGFTLRTADGRLEQYAVGILETGGAAFPAAHLREHLASLLPIVVTYRLETGRRVAIRLEDAPLPSGSG